MYKTIDIFPRLVILDLSEEQNKIFREFCNKNLEKNPDVITYGDMWYYASDKHRHNIVANENHTEIMKVMWGIFMKKDASHSKVFFYLIPRDEVREMMERLYKLLIKNMWI